MFSYVQSIYHIIIMRFKEQKSWTPPTAHPPLNKTKISGIKSEILIKYKRIKWTLAVRLRTYSQGDKTNISGIESEILIKYKRIKWTLAVRLRSLTPRGKGPNTKAYSFFYRKIVSYLRSEMLPNQKVL